MRFAFLAWHTDRACSPDGPYPVIVDRRGRYAVSRLVVESTAVHWAHHLGEFALPGNAAFTMSKSATRRAE